MKIYAYFVIALSLVSGHDVRSKTFSSCFNEWRIPTCSDKDPAVGRTCESMERGYDACLAEIRAEDARKKNEREAKARERMQKEEAEAARQKQERAAKQRDSKRAEIEAVEKANNAARELQKLNGPRPTGSPSTSGTILPAAPRDNSEKKGF